MYILASKSPRRKQLMQEIVPAFSIIESNIDETKYTKETPLETVKEIALQKGLDVFKNHQNDIVISADTIVVLDNKIYGKPKDKNDAFKILKELSNKTHEVITAYAILAKGVQILNAVSTSVTFKKLSDNLILRYIESGSPLDKAGAYGIQDNDTFPIINKIVGSYKNVVGFPVEQIRYHITKLKNI